MFKNSTYVVKAMPLFILLSGIIIFPKAQTASTPKLKFASPLLFSGIAGQEDAICKTSIPKGYNNIRLSGLSSFSSGIYMADILVNGNVVNRQKVVKQ